MLEISDGRALLPDGRIEKTSIFIEDGRVAGLDRAPYSSARRLRARGCLVLPGIVDLHGDGFERQIMPRPGILFPPEPGLLETDRQLIANGITTAFHSLTLTWEPGLRGREAALRFLTALERLKPRLRADTRLHLRFEVLHLDGVEEVLAWIAQGRIDLLAFNDHADYISRRLDSSRSLAILAGRTGLGREEFVRRFKATLERRAEVPAAVRRLAQAARERGLPLASHDDETPESRRFYHDLGCGICEFPVNRATAEAARQNGDPIVMGAPNVLHGQSQYDRLSAKASVAEGLCTVLSTDYFYPAPLLAPFILVREGVCPFGRAWDLVSANPAAAVGLGDRGRIEAGKRADLILVDDSDPNLPQVLAVVAAGRVVYLSGESLDFLG